MTYSELAIKVLNEAESEPEVGRTHYLLARAVVWALLAIAVAIESRGHE